MDVNTLQGLFTIVAMLAFLGVVWWAYRSTNRKRFEEDARIPFADEAGNSPAIGDRER
jgi:cytochrome c oxidase cbb3-type subunit 4